MSDCTEELVWTQNEGVVVLRINRPERGNSVNASLAKAVEAAWQRIEADPEVRVAVITAAGDRHFCTGADVKDVLTEGNSMKNRPIHEVLKLSPQQNRVTKPVICAVNGLASGGGLHFVVDADIVVASDKASFADTHVNVGQVGAVENIGLAKRLPLGTALRMTLQGRDFRLSARRAFELGLVDELVESPTDLMEKALEIAHSIAANSPQAMALSKQAIWDSLEMSYTQACANGWNLLRLQWQHPDFEEGPRAYGERRDPRWNPDPDARRDG